jgi:methyltransferase (TIGR00027 family)
MAMPNLSNSMYVARLRHIQSIHESPERHNPDTLVRHFVPLLVRIRTALLGKAGLSKLRLDPFYYYLIARTQHYDDVVRDAISDGVQRLIMVGCGSDTRSYRFKNLLCGKGVKVLECDLAEAISEKQRLTGRWRDFGHVEYLALDLNDGAWPKLESWLGNTKPKTLVLMEGVSPYVNDDALGQFLGLLATRLAVGSHVAYDFKIRGVKDNFGRDGRTQRPFRLSTAKDEVAAFHQALGFWVGHMEVSSELVSRLLPDLNGYPLFEEDGLLRLRVIGV